MSARNAMQGMKWIRNERRLAIYLRDGLACVYCGDTVEDGAKLTLDHLKPNSRGGTNDTTNLVTCCHRCNSSRGNRNVREFTRSVANYLNHGIDAEAIERHVRNCARRVIDTAEAKMLIARRGGFVAALKGDTK